jgi:hypothetical protein
MCVCEEAKKKRRWEGLNCCYLTIHYSATTIMETPQTHTHTHCYCIDEMIVRRMLLHEA